MLADRLRVWKTAYNTANLPGGHDAPAGRGLEVARHHPRGRLLDDRDVRAHRRPAGRRRRALAQIGGDASAAVNVDYGCSPWPIVGLVVAHAANNMINDYFDLEGGIDTDDYVRAQYAPHPILSGWVTKRQLGDGDPDRERDRPRDPAVPDDASAARSSPRSRSAGLFVSVFYVAPPIRLKHIGLGEPGVFIVWGPLMVVGHVLRGHRPDPGLGLDRLAALRDPRDDASCSASTSTRSRPTRRRASGRCPCILGERRARRVAQALMIAFYPIVLGAALVGWIGPWVRARRARHPAPADGAQGLRPAEAGRRRRTATSAGRCGSWAGVHPHAPRRRAADPGPAPERVPADQAALAVGPSTRGLRGSSPSASGLAQSDDARRGIAADDGRRGPAAEARAALPVRRQTPWVTLAPWTRGPEPTRPSWSSRARPAASSGRARPAPPGACDRRWISAATPSRPGRVRRRRGRRGVGRPGAPRRPWWCRPAGRRGASRPSRHRPPRRRPSPARGPRPSRRRRSGVRPEPEVSIEAPSHHRAACHGPFAGRDGAVLGLARRTADRRLAEARRGLGVTRTTEAIARARRLGWLDRTPGSLFPPGAAARHLRGSDCSESVHADARSAHRPRMPGSRWLIGRNSELASPGRGRRP